MKDEAASVAMRLIDSISDDERGRMVFDHKKEIIALAYVMGAVTEQLGAVAAAPTLRVAAETLFYLGYQAGSRDSL